MSHRGRLERSFGFKFKSMFSHFDLFEGGVGLVGQYRMPKDYFIQEKADKIHEKAKDRLMREVATQIFYWLENEGHLTWDERDQWIKKIGRVNEHPENIVFIEPWKYRGSASTVIREET